MTISKIQDLDKELKENKLEKYKIILASFDPRKDKPENLKKYMKKRGLEEELWTFLSPQSDSDVRELAGVLGISYKDLGDGDFSHSNVITLFDRNGVVVSRLESLSADTASFISQAKSLGPQTVQKK